MSPFSVTLQRVPDRELGPLLIQLAQAGFHHPAITPVECSSVSVPNTKSCLKKRTTAAFRLADQATRRSTTSFSPPSVKRKP